MSSHLRPAALFLLASLVLFASSGFLFAEEIPYAPSAIEAPTPEWRAIVEEASPTEATVEADTRQVLVFDLFTGFNHLVTPHTTVAIDVVGEKSGAFETTSTKDIEMLTPQKLAAYDVLVLNNNCSVGPRRNLLLDVLERDERYADLTDEERQDRSDALEQSMLDFVADGNGLVVMHGAPTLLNNSPEFTGMVGAAFHYHPPNQAVTVRAVDEDHPLVAAFKGKGPFIHRDEPYCFNGAYEALDFRPLLSMDTEGLSRPGDNIDDLPRYVSWIKPHGEGRVFYCSPSHFPTTFESPTILQFLLDGIQYAAGDLECDDSTPEE
jgi:uncharacterized protein